MAIISILLIVVLLGLFMRFSVTNVISNTMDAKLIINTQGIDKPLLIEDIKDLKPVSSLWKSLTKKQVMTDPSDLCFKLILGPIN